MSKRKSSMFPDCRRHVERLGVGLCGAILVVSSAGNRPVGAQSAPPPVSYVGTEQADASADGSLRLAAGVHNAQVVRSNRTKPSHADGLTHTYLHAPMLAYWRGRFYLEYLSGPRHEHEAPCPTSITSSRDGLNWASPRIVFPALDLPDGRLSITHQRMGFYVASNGRLLALAFHGAAPNPNDGTGVGRVVREIHEDDTFGPVYFIRYNRHSGWSEGNTPYPHFSSSPDAGFQEACRALLADKLITEQWWEEDRSDDGFYATQGKAFSFFHRADGSVVGLWKNALTAVSRDEGRTWSKPVEAGNMPQNGSKYWGQRTTDGRYALVLNPTNRLRYPLAVMLSDDGSRFGELLTVHGEVPDQRFEGRYKNLGPQYVRGIVEGNGSPEGSALWVTYSVNKEDIWVSRIPVPIRGQVSSSVNDAFDEEQLGSLPSGWNVYSPSWAPVRIVGAGGDRGRVLELRDEEPYDYARAQRLFPESRSVRVAFKLIARQTDAPLEVDVLGPRGERAVQIALRANGRIAACHEGVWQDGGAYRSDRWMSFEILVNRGKDIDRFELLVDGRPVLWRPGVFTEPTKALARVSFRTGPHRPRGSGGEDLPGADERSKAAVFQIDDVVIGKLE